MVIERRKESPTKAPPRFPYWKTEEGYQKTNGRKERRNERRNQKEEKTESEQGEKGTEKGNGKKRKKGL